MAGHARSLCSNFVPYESGLQVRDVRVGREDGMQAEVGDQCSVHFTGKLQDGTVFDTSLNEALKGNQVEFKVKEGDDLLGWDRGNPIMFVVGNGEVIAGWDEGVLGLRVGGIRELIVPPHLGYGEKGAGETIPPNAVLHFEIELLDVRNASGGGGGGRGGLWASVTKLWS